MIRILPVSVFLIVLLTFYYIGFAQSKLPTGVYKTVERSSFKYIDEVGDTLLLDSIAICNSSDFASVTMEYGYADRPVVEVVLTEPGRKLFASATREQVEKKIAIIGNGKLLSAPVVQSEIAGGLFQIAGNYSVEEATQLAERIRKEIKDNSPFSEVEKMVFNTQLSQSVKMLDNALLANYAKGLDKLLHEDLSMGHSNGWVENKEEVLRHLNSGFLVYQDITPVGEIEIGVIENFARVRRKIKVRGVADKVNFEMELKVMEVWVLEFGRWKLWCRQSVQLKK